MVRGKPETIIRAYQVGVEALNHLIAEGLAEKLHGDHYALTRTGVRMWESQQMRREIGTMRIKRKTGRAPQKRDRFINVKQPLSETSRAFGLRSSNVRVSTRSCSAAAVGAGADRFVQGFDLRDQVRLSHGG